MPNINNGLSKDDMESLAAHLCAIQSDLQLLATKTQGFHWNVEGPNFIALHEFFGRQYGALIATIDLVAERVRALGHFPITSLKDIVEIGSYVKEVDGPIPADSMLTMLLSDYERMAKHARMVTSQALHNSDDTTANMLADIVGLYEKEAWMLRSLLGKG